MTVGLIVGVGVYQGMAPIYRGVVSFTLTPATPEFTDVCREDLLRFAWQASRSSTSAITDWHVATTGPLELELEGPQRARLQTALTQLGDDFVTHVQSDWTRRAELPSEGERVVAELLEVFYAHRGAARDASSSAGDSSTRRALDARDQAMQDLTDARNRLEESRAVMAARRQDLDSVSNAPFPIVAWVSPAQREQYRRDDPNLQQDLAELHVHYAAVRRQLLDGWQVSAPPVDDLLAAAGQLRRVCLSAIAQAPTDAVDAMLQKLLDESTAYHDRLSSFCSSWNKEFVVLQRTPADPQDDAPLRSHAAIHQRLGDFQFDGIAQIHRLDLAARALDTDADAAARLYKLRTKLGRAIEELKRTQAAFFRLAGQTHEAENFRLDGALRSARGLRRRVYQRWLEIESRLEVDALAQAVDNHQAAIDQARVLFSEALDAMDAATATLAAAGDQLSLHIVSADEEIRLRALGEQGAEWLASADRLVAEGKRRLAALAEQRRQAVPQAAIELGAGEVGERTVAPARRLGAAILAGLAATVLLLGAQRWLLAPLRRAGI